MNKTKELKHSAYGINYYVTKNSDLERPYGITAELESDSTDQMGTDGLFFTSEEAGACCKWLAENEVYPITLCEVLENLYTL